MPKVEIVLEKCKYYNGKCKKTQLPNRTGLMSQLQFSCYFKKLKKFLPPSPASVHFF